MENVIRKCKERDTGENSVKERENKKKLNNERWEGRCKRRGDT